MASTPHNSSGEHISNIPKHLVVLLNTENHFDRWCHYCGIGLHHNISSQLASTNNLMGILAIGGWSCEADRDYPRKHSFLRPTGASLWETEKRNWRHQERKILTSKSGPDPASTAFQNQWWYLHTRRNSEVHNTTWSQQQQRVSSKHL